MSIFNKIKGLVYVTDARTTIQSGEEIDASFDKQGRLITYPYGVRGAISTASSVITRNDRTEILGAVAGYFTDIVTVVASNTSTSAISVDLRSGRDSGITVSINAAASGNSVIKFDPPLPANEASSAWVATASSVAADSGDSPVTLNLIAVNNL